MTRDEVFARVKAHLADELRIDPERIGEQTRFREDLGTDSLDLYTLLQELEDSYGIKIPDEQSLNIRTVGEAVDFVVSIAGDARTGG
jgi:acyl carrier protein